MKNNQNEKDNVLEIGDTVISTIKDTMIGSINFINGDYAVVDISGKDVLFNKNYLRKIKFDVN